MSASLLVLLGTELSLKNDKPHSCLCIYQYDTIKKTQHNSAQHNSGTVVIICNKMTPRFALY